MYSQLQVANFNRGLVNSVSANRVARPEVANTSYVQSPIQRPVFKGQNNTIAVQTQLNTKEDIQKYSDVVKNLDKEGRVAIDYLLKTGVLLNNKSNDKTSTLDNLHKILTTPRAQGLDAVNILNTTVKTLAKPTLINQRFGDIPVELQNTLVDYQTNGSQDNAVRANALNSQNVKDNGSGCCVAASIEYNLASQLPAEFARVANGLSSESMSVTKEIDLKTLCDNKEDSLWLLDNFKVPYTLKDNNKVEITIAPDKNAIIRAHIQTNYKDEEERSAVDVLMQSTFMNVGSQQTYNSIDDKRVASFGVGDRGLVEIEKTFTESVVTDTCKTSVTFQNVESAKDSKGNDVAKLTGYTTDFNTVKRSLLNSMANGQNVIIGYTSTDEENNVVNGHEITIVGAKLAQDGKLIFVCNDTDDNSTDYVEYHEDYIIPRIHHVGLSQEVVDADAELKKIA